MKTRGRRVKPVRVKCDKCKINRSVEVFRGKNLCRDCLCADELPIYVPTMRCGLGPIGSNTPFGFNVAAFSVDISKAMQARGMKYDRWSEKKDYYKEPRR